MSNSGFNPREPAPADARGCYWACTINTHEDDPHGYDLTRSLDQIKSLHEDGSLSYAVGQWELGETTGRLHLQCYLIFKERKYCNWIASRIYRCMLFLSKAGWAKKGIEYCKDINKPTFVREGFEYGSNPGVFQGKRSDLDDVNFMISENKLTTYREVNDYRTSVAARHANWVNWRLAEASKDEYLSEDRYDDPYVPYVWQYWMARILSDTRPSERKVLFVVDKLGHSGKTRFTFEFSRSTNKRFQVMRAMPKRDMASALEYRREVLWIDIPRGKLEFIDTVYVFMEEAKDGVVGNEKYGSHTQYNKRMHVVCFLNDDVNIGRTEAVRTYVPPNHSCQGFDWTNKYVLKSAPLSHDRYAIWDLDLTPGLKDVWSPESMWYDRCPPFIAYDRDWNQIEYNPPVPPTSGPEFAGDMAGDGPFQIHAQLSVSIQIYDLRRICEMRTMAICTDDPDEIGYTNEFLSTLMREGMHYDRSVVTVDYAITHGGYVALQYETPEYNGNAFRRWVLESDINTTIESPIHVSNCFYRNFNNMVENSPEYLGIRTYNEILRRCIQLAGAFVDDAVEFGETSMEEPILLDNIWFTTYESDIPSHWEPSIIFGVSDDSVCVGDYTVSEDLTLHVYVGGTCAPAA